VTGLHLANALRYVHVTESSFIGSAGQTESVRFSGTAAQALAQDIRVHALTESGHAVPVPAVLTRRNNVNRFIQRLLAGQPQKIITYGTSLTAMGLWQTQLLEVLERHFPGLVIFENTGRNGQNSNWGVANLDDRVISRQPDCVFIEFTINDSVERFALSPAQSRANLEAMIDRVSTALPDCEIVLQLMNPAVGFKPGDTSYRRDQPTYQQIYRDVAIARGLTLIDNVAAWQAVLDRGGEAAFFLLVRDGVHPNSTGWATVVLPNLLETLGLAESYAAWRRNHPNASPEGMGDSDGDGLADLFEYRLGLSPSQADAAEANVADLLTDGTLRFWTPWLAERTDVAVGAELSDDFAAWTDAMPGEHTLFTSDGTSFYVVVSPGRFLRLKAHLRKP